MPVLIILILSSLGLYIYYKIQYFRTKQDLSRRFLTAKSTIALGTFVALFGINRIYISQETVPLIISFIFIVIGTLSIWSGMRAYRFYLPRMVKELEKDHTSTDRGIP